MKKKIIITVLSLSVFLLSFTSASEIKAEFEGKELEYIEKCRSTTLSEVEKQECVRFDEYYRKQQEQLKEDLESNELNMANIKSNMDTLTKQVNSYSEQMTVIEANIKQMEKAGAEIAANIKKLSSEIKVKIADIKKRDKEIKSRMLAMQPAASTNMYFDFIMGATDLIDFVRRTEGIKQLTSYDQEQIKKLDADKKALENNKKEMERQKLVLDEQLTRKDLDLAHVKKLKEQSEDLLQTYRSKESSMAEQFRGSAGSIEEGKKYFKPILYTTENVGSDSWELPIKDDYEYSAHTFYYPDGESLHLGLDFAPVNGVGAPILSPIDGIIFYASNPSPTIGGLGNWVGYPAGGGNTVHIVGKVNGTTYAISFFHMNERGFLAGDLTSVKQGQQIGTVGSSGNSSGPHLHLEIINLGDMTIKKAAETFTEKLDFSWGTGWNSLKTACAYNGGVAPCREKPERVLGIYY
ncbi:MAG: peptidoglycan DD-metalloendopeptidase family protein [Erysipelotrichaceae bacterium]